MIEPVKETTLRDFIKEKTGLRVEGGAVEVLVKRVTDRIGRIVERAAVLVEMQGKSTLQAADMERAIEEIDSGSNGQGQSPEEVYEDIERYGVQELGDLARRLEKSLE